MGVAVLILGDSGSGKSTSLRNFDKDEVAVMSILGKRLPFRKKLDVLNHAGYGAVQQALSRNTRQAYVIDDAGYLMQLENFRRAKETGYQKYVEIAQHFEQLIEWAMNTNEDTIVYLMMHYDTDANGKQKRGAAENHGGVESSAVKSSQLVRLQKAEAENKQGSQRGKAEQQSRKAQDHRRHRHRIFRAELAEYRDRHKSGSADQHRKREIKNKKAAVEHSGKLVRPLDCFFHNNLLPTYTILIIRSTRRSVKKMRGKSGSGKKLKIFKKSFQKGVDKSTLL